MKTTYNKNYYERNKEKKLAWQKKYYQANKEKDRVWRREYYKKNSRKLKDMIMRKKYGITHEQFDDMKERQRNRCCICKSLLFGNKNCCVDHDHSTNKVRGLLCGSCNLGLGKFKDSILVLESAIDYLRLHG